MKTWGNFLSFVPFLLVLFARGSNCNESTHEYKPHDKVTLWVNRIGPYHNPTETYPYYQIPYCKPVDGLETKKKRVGLGEILEANELRNSGYEIMFAEDVESKVVCSLDLNMQVLSELEVATDQLYWYQMYLDDLPMWGFVGTSKPSEGNLDVIQRFVYTHRLLEIGFNGNRIVEVNLKSQSPQKLQLNDKLEFSYSVHWYSSSRSFDNRFHRYLEDSFFENEIHWFSIFNSFMMVVFLCGLVSLILLQTLRKDLARIADMSSRGADVESSNGSSMTLISASGGFNIIGDDSGWKQVHGDVFRPPRNLELFSAILGIGCQIFLLLLLVILYSLAGPIHGDVYEERGDLAEAVLVSYALSSAIAGYVSGSNYKSFFTSPRAEANSRWQSTLILTIIIFPCLVLSVSVVLNQISVYYDTINAIPITALAKVFALWIFVAVPLCIIGTLCGRNLKPVDSKQRPPRIATIPRPIPSSPLYFNTYFLILIAGSLPFGSIFIEMYFIFTSLWGYKFYYVFGIMLLVYLLLALVVSCTVVVAVYIHLNAENHKWHWFSFNCGGSIALYTFMYAVYYFYYKTQMSGLLQTAYYFGYMFILSLCLYLACGAVGEIGAIVFVKSIYDSIKAE